MYKLSLGNQTHWYISVTAVMSLIEEEKINAKEA